MESDGFSFISCNTSHEELQAHYHKLNIRRSIVLMKAKCMIIIYSSFYVVYMYAHTNGCQHMKCTYVYNYMYGLLHTWIRTLIAIHMDTYSHSYTHGYVQTWIHK